MANITREEIIEIVGRIDDSRIAQIIETGAAAAEVTEAFTRLSEDTDLGAELQRPLSGTVAAVYEILKRDEPPGPERD